MVVRAKLDLNRGAINQIGLREARRKVTDMTRATFNRANILTPVDTGNLRTHNSQRVYQAGLVVYGEVFNLAEYAAAVHNGTRRHTIYPKTRPVQIGTNSAGLPIYRSGVLRFKAGGRTVYARHVTMPARKGRPWLVNAMVQTAPRYGFTIVTL